MVKVLSILSGFVVCAAAVSLPGHALHEKRGAPTRHWMKKRPVQANAKLPMRMGLTQNNLDRGHDVLMQVSDHDSPDYGKYLSAEQVADLFAPAESAVAAVRAWLETAGIATSRVSQSANKQWLQFDADVHEAERLFKTKYHHFEHMPTGRNTIACDEYYLPEHIQPHVDYITPGLKLMAGGKSTTERLAGREHELERRGFRTSASSTFSGPIIGNLLSNDTLNLIKAAQVAHCDQYVTPACIALMYQIPQGTKASANNQLGIFEEGDYYGAEDLVEFFATLAQNIPILTQPTVNGIDGGSAPSLVDGAESDLDLQV